MPLDMTNKIESNRYQLEWTTLEEFSGYKD